MKVLIVDDDPIILMTISSNLEKWGYQPVTAETGEQAWELMQQPDAPTMIVIDWMLPNGMNGIELCKLLKNRGSLHFSYIIMLTGRMSSDDVVIGLNSGADDYLIKPVDASELKARVFAGERVLNKYEELKQTPISQQNNEIAKFTKPISFSAPQLLIAEDDPVSREVIKENFQRWGFNPIVASNGQEALDGFKRCEGPFLAVIDWMMPELSGVEVCREIKKIAEDGSCYLILLTAKTQREDVVQGLESGADDYLCKPFHAAELRARLDVGIRTLSANRHLKAIVSNNSEGIVTVGGDSVIDSFNPAAERMFGYQVNEMLGQNMTTLFLEEETGRYRQYLKDCSLGILKSSTSSIELTGLRKDQSTFPLEINIACMDYDSSKRFVGIIRDISDQKNIEGKLIKAKDRAEKADKAKSEFLSSMSHELRTPLNAIIGFAQLLETDPDNPLVEDQKEALNYILQGGHHLLGLINEILDLAKIESGQVSMEITKVNINEAIKDSVSLVQQLAVSNDVEMSQSSITENHWVKADSERLRQIIINLLSNAIKYNSRPGKIFIETTQPLNNVLRVTVQDTGKGIEKEKQNQLFKPFSRLGAEITDIEGTGIGLVITKTLIEEMNGSIGVESEVGKDSSFWIELPVFEIKE